MAMKGDIRSMRYAIKTSIGVMSMPHMLSMNTQKTIQWYTHLCDHLSVNHSFNPWVIMLMICQPPTTKYPIKKVSSWRIRAISRKLQINMALTQQSIFLKVFMFVNFKISEKNENITY